MVAIPDYGWVSPVPSTLQEVSSLFLVCEALFSPRSSADAERRSSTTPAKRFTLTPTPDHCG